MKWMISLSYCIPCPAQLQLQLLLIIAQTLLCSASGFFSIMLITISSGALSTSPSLSPTGVMSMRWRGTSEEVVALGGDRVQLSCVHGSTGAGGDHSAVVSEGAAEYKEAPAMVSYGWEGPWGPILPPDRYEEDIETSKGGLHHQPRFSVEVCATPSSASKQCPQLTIFPVGRGDSGMYTCMATLLRHTSAPPLNRRRQGKEQDWGEGSEAEKGREGPIIRYYPVHKVNLLVYDLPLFSTGKEREVTLLTGTHSLIPCHAHMPKTTTTTTATRTTSSTMTEESADIRHSSSSNSSNSSRRGDGSVPVSWSKVGALLDPLRVWTTEDGSLSIRNVSKQTAGTYICTAYLYSAVQNPPPTPYNSSINNNITERGGGKRGWVVAKSESVVHLVVKDSMAFRVEPKDEEVGVGEDALFHCAADNSSVIFWELHPKDGEPEILFPLQVEDRQGLHMGVYPNNSLYIRGLLRGQRQGEITDGLMHLMGVTCVADSHRAHAKLIVKDYPGCKVPLFRRTPNDVTVFSPSSNAHLEGEATMKGVVVLLECSVENVDRKEHRVHWFFRASTGLNYDLVQSSDRRMILPSGHLQILFARDDDHQQPQETDAGEYRCEVFCRGKIQDSATATVRFITQYNNNNNTSILEKRTKLGASMQLMASYQQIAPFVERINSSEAQLSWLSNYPHHSICGVLEFYCRDGRMAKWNKSMACHVQTPLRPHSVTIGGLSAGTECMAAVRAYSLQYNITAPLSPITFFTTTPSIFGINESASADDADGVEHGKVKGERGHIHGELMSHVVSFSQVQLHWTIHPQQNFKGFDVKCNYNLNQTLRELKWRTPDGSWRSWRLGNLNASTFYECFVVGHTLKGTSMVTQVVIFDTVAQPPPSPPRNLLASATPHVPSSVVITWDEPQVGPLEGLITGYQVWYSSGHDLTQQKIIQLGPETTEVSLPLVASTEHSQIRVEVAALSGLVLGHRSDPVLVQLTDPLLQPQSGPSSFPLSLMRNPWLLVSVGVLLWLLLLSFCVFIIRRCHLSRKLSHSGHPNSQWFTMEDAFRQGVYPGDNYDHPRNHQQVTNRGGGYSRSGTAQNCMAPNEHSQLHPCHHHHYHQHHHPYQAGENETSCNPREPQRQSGLGQLECSSRSVPNLVCSSDVGSSEERYEEISNGNAWVREVRQNKDASQQGRHITTSRSSQQCCGDPPGTLSGSYYVPHYDVYDAAAGRDSGDGDSSSDPCNLYERATSPVACGMSPPLQDTSSSASPNTANIPKTTSVNSYPVQPPSASTATTTAAATTVQLRPKMGSHALMQPRRTTSIHGHMGLLPPPPPPPSHTHKDSRRDPNHDHIRVPPHNAVTMLPRTSTIMPLVQTSALFLPPSNEDNCRHTPTRLSKFKSSTSSQPPPLTPHPSSYTSPLSMVSTYTNATATGTNPDSISSRKLNRRGEFNRSTTDDSIPAASLYSQVQTVYYHELDPCRISKSPLGDDTYSEGECTVTDAYEELPSFSGNSVGDREGSLSDINHRPQSIYSTC